MTKKIVVRTGDVAGFFDRAKNAAKRADQGGSFDGTVTLSFEDPQKRFTVLSQARRRLMQEIMLETKTRYASGPQNRNGCHPGLISHRPF